VASDIAAAFAAGTMPDALAQAIRQWYAQLGAGGVPVAVRSSATVEDLPIRSFAGQQATYLNIGGADLLDAIILISAPGNATMLWMSLRRPWSHR